MLNLFFKTLIHLTFAADPCSSYSAVTIDTVEVGKDHLLVACGNTGETVTLSMVLDIQKENVKVLFMGSDSMKSYSFKKVNNEYFIKESMNMEGALPFIERHISCSNDVCSFTEICLWKKSPADESVLGSIEMQLKRSPANVSDEQLIRLFYTALNGSKRAQNLLATPFLNANVSGSEYQALFREDIARLRKAKCL